MCSLHCASLAQPFDVIGFLFSYFRLPARASILFPCRFVMHSTLNAYPVASDVHIFANDFGYRKTYICLAVPNSSGDESVSARPYNLKWK